MYAFTSGSSSEHSCGGILYELWVNEFMRNATHASPSSTSQFRSNLRQAERAQASTSFPQLLNSVSVQFSCWQLEGREIEAVDQEKDLEENPEAKKQKVETVEMQRETKTVPTGLDTVANGKSEVKKVRELIQLI